MDFVRKMLVEIEICGAANPAKGRAAGIRNTTKLPLFYLLPDSLRNGSATG